ncbi:hypothetical protein BPOR_0938g00020 [Botrytis porri]|uniref:Uncharacterized protein n=1 Tax=Botrytis porri TaxID=87229 RepID=A0A4Z1KKQ5_9HELO|nr:hypothetical protein BPOR_0938g00020 [Botrytis porri]
MDSPKEIGRVSENDIDIQQREAIEAWEREEDSDIENHDIHYIIFGLWFVVQQCARGEIRAEVGRSVGDYLLYAHQPSNSSSSSAYVPPPPPLPL